MSFPYKYIAIEGNIGAGKTSLAMKLSSEMKSEIILEEFEENPFLEKFYRDPDNYSLQVELSFLLDRIRQLNNFFYKKRADDKLTISDYFIGKCLIFSRNNLKEDAYGLFCRLYDALNYNLPQPDMLVYLNSGVNRLQGNIRKRGREYEQSIPDSYLLNLEALYLEFLMNHISIPTLWIDTNDKNFIENLDYFNTIKEAILNFPTKIERKIVLK